MSKQMERVIVQLRNAHAVATKAERSASAHAQDARSASRRQGEGGPEGVRLKGLADSAEKLWERTDTAQRAVGEILALLQAEAHTAAARAALKKGA